MGTSIRGRFRSRRGSASALIVLMVVLLAVFGAMALTSAAASLRLARRHADWSIEYYGYDASAEKLLARIDLTVSEAIRTSQDTETLRSRLGAITSPGASSITCAREGERLVVSALAGDPDTRGISVAVAVQIGINGSSRSADLRVIRWSQFQKPFNYDAGPGGVWNGG
jgi:hypothetical protein